MDEKTKDGGPQSDVAEPRYSIAEVSDLSGISAFTLRYYDKCGFFPYLYRDKNKRRKFSDADITWLRLVDALRKSGLSIEGTKYFVRLHTQGSKTLQERRAIIQVQEASLEYQLSEMQENLCTLKSESVDLSRKINDLDVAEE